MSKSSITIDPIHPGEILKEEFLDELHLSAAALARQIGVPTNRITRVLNGESSVTADTAMLLGAALGTTPEFWLNLQFRYELERARMDKGLAERARKVVRLVAAA